MADGFKSGMTKLGYIEGENITYDVQAFNPAVDTEATGAERLRKMISDGVNLIFAFTTEQAIMAKAATQGTGVPVVFGFAGLEGNDLVESVQAPGGNITGVRFTGPQSTAKRLELLHEIVPGAKRIGVFYQVDYSNSAPALELMRPLAKNLGISLMEIPVYTVKDIQTELEALAQKEDIGMDALLQMPDAATHSPDGSALLMAFAKEHHLPYGGGQFYQADQGAVFAYSPYNVEMGELAAPIADKILKGAPAGAIPLVSPENHLIINYKVAQELGLTVPEGLLKQASKVLH
jgi:putative ABC transport system substrate-binding protein